MFLTPLDEVRGWWRYHQLFADLLRARLAQERPERLPRLHGAAAAWLDGHGLVDHAIQHALLAGDTTAAAELVERNIEPMLGRGETTRWRATRPAEPDQGPTLAGDQGATVAGWLDALPADVVQSRPRLCAIRAILAVIAGQGGELEHWVDTAERALAAASTEEPIGSGSDQVGWAGSPLADMPGTIAILRADLARLRGDADTAIRLTRQLVSRLAPAERVLRFNAEWNLARANWVNGDLSRAEQALAELIAAARVAGEHYLILTVCWELGRVQRARGRLGAALATYRQALGIGTELGSPALPALGIARLGVAAVLYERGELTTAPEDSPSYAREPEHLMLARVLLSQGEPRPGLPAAGAAPGRGGRPAAHRLPDRAGAAAGTSPGRERRSGRRAGRAGRGGHAGLARRLPARVHRRRRGPFYPARPAHRRPPPRGSTGRRRPLGIPGAAPRDADARRGRSRSAAGIGGPGNGGAGRALDQPGTRSAQSAGRGHGEPADRQGAGGGTGDSQEARQPHTRQARRRQPHPGGGTRPCTGAAPVRRHGPLPLWR